MIQRMEGDDLDRIVDLERLCFSSPWSKDDFLYELNENPFGYYVVLKEEDKILAYEDSCKRNAVEGVFGVCKRKYGMNKIISKLKETSETEISLQVLVMNLGTLLRRVFLKFFL